GTGAGSAYVFVRSGSSWSQQQQLTASDAAATDNFGDSVALDGNTVVVGAPSDDTRAGISAGSVYVFVRSGSSWSQQQPLSAGDAAAFDFFGWSVAHDGTLVVVATRFSSDGGTGAGSAYVFVRSGSSWSQQQQLTASDAAATDNFGTSVTISGD